MATKKQSKTAVVKVVRGFMYAGAMVPAVQGKDKKEVIVEAPLGLARELIANGKAEAVDGKKNFDLPKPEDSLEDELDGK